MLVLMLRNILTKVSLTKLEYFWQISPRVSSGNSAGLTSVWGGHFWGRILKFVLLNV